MSMHLHIIIQIDSDFKDDYKKIKSDGVKSEYRRQEFDNSVYEIEGNTEAVLQHFVAIGQSGIDVLYINNLWTPPGLHTAR